LTDQHQIPFTDWSTPLSCKLIYDINARASAYDAR